MCFASHLLRLLNGKLSTPFVITQLWLQVIIVFLVITKTDSNIIVVTPEEIVFMFITSVREIYT
jgi:hypothetical protein